MELREETPHPFNPTAQNDNTVPRICQDDLAELFKKIFILPKMGITSLRGPELWPKALTVTTNEWK